MTISVGFLVRSLAPIATIARHPGVYSNVSGTSAIDRAPPSAFAIISSTIPALCLFAAVSLVIANWTIGLPTSVVALGLLSFAMVAVVSFLGSRFRQATSSQFGRGISFGLLSWAIIATSCAVLAMVVTGTIPISIAALATTMFAVSAIYICANELEHAHKGTIYAPGGRRPHLIHVAVVGFMAASLALITVSSAIGIGIIALDIALVLGVAYITWEESSRTFATTSASATIMNPRLQDRQFSVFGQIIGTISYTLSFRWMTRRATATACDQHEALSTA